MGRKGLELKIGTKSNYLKTIGEPYTPHRKTSNKNRVVECECLFCGSIKAYRVTDISQNKRLSCGCKLPESIKKQQELIGKKHPLWQGHGEISGQFWDGLKRGAQSRNHSFKITIKDAWQQFLKQKGKCALSGEGLTFATDLPCNKREKARTASLDRIDNGKGYTKDNIQWVHKFVNKLKHTFSQDELIEWCHKISNHQKEDA